MKTDSGTPWGGCLEGNINHENGVVHRLTVALGYVLDFFGLKKLSNQIFADNVTSYDAEYVIHRALCTMLELGRSDLALRTAERAWRVNKRVRLGRDLIHIYLRKRLYTEALDTALIMKGAEPDNPWLSILPGDIQYFFLNDQEGALNSYLKAYTVCGGVSREKQRNEMRDSTGSRSHRDMQGTTWMREQSGMKNEAQSGLQSGAQGRLRSGTQTGLQSEAQSGPSNEAQSNALNRVKNKDALAVVLKRLTHIYKMKEDWDRLYEILEEFFALGPTNFHDDEFIMLAKERLKRGNHDGALEVLKEGLAACPRSEAIRDFLRQMGSDPGPYIPKRSRVKAEGLSSDTNAGLATQDSATGDPETGAVQAEDCREVKKIPVKTRIVFEGDNIVDVIQQYVTGIVQPSDVVTISSCVAGLAEGRMAMEGTVVPSLLAILVSRLVKGRHVGRFEATAPMSNPLSVQVLLEEIGTMRVLLATVIGAITKMLRMDGWFYHVAGSQSALIDDIMGSIPPYDYYVIMGPLDSYGLSQAITSKLGCRGAAVIDANDLGIAWAVGYSGNINPTELERALEDNPAGNQDQRTPIVIVRT